MLFRSQPLPSTPQPVPPQPIPPKKGLSKGALWGIIGGVLGLILVITAVVLAVIFLAGPSKEDYVAIRSQVKEVKTQSKNIKEKTSDFLGFSLNSITFSSTISSLFSFFKISLISDNLSAAFTIP